MVSSITARALVEPQVTGRSIHLHCRSFTQGECVSPVQCGRCVLRRKSDCKIKLNFTITQKTVKLAERLVWREAAAALAAGNEIEHQVSYPSPLRRHGVLSGVLRANCPMAAAVAVPTEPRSSSAPRVSGERRLFRSVQLHIAATLQCTAQASPAPVHRLEE